MDSEHVVATYAAHILQFSTTHIHVSCGYRFARRPKSLCSSVERFIHGETPSFGEPPLTVGLFDPNQPPMTAPLTSRRLHLVGSALSGLLPPLRPSPLPTPPREGRRFVTNKDASTAKTSEEVLSIRRLSTPLDDPMLFARDPFGPLARRFHAQSFRSTRSPARHCLSACAAQHDPRTNPQSPIPLFGFPNGGDVPPKGPACRAPPREEHRL